MGCKSSKNLKSKNTLTVLNNCNTINRLNKTKTIYTKKKAEVISYENNMDDLKQKAEIFVSLKNIKSSMNNEDNLVPYYRIKLGIINDKKYMSNVLSCIDTNFLTDEENITYPDSCIIDYYFEKEQIISYQIYQKDNFNSQEIKILDDIITLARIMGSKNNTFTLNFEDFDFEIVANNASGLDISYTFDVKYFFTNLSKDYSNFYYAIKNFNDKKGWRYSYKSEEVIDRCGKFDSITLDANACNNGILTQKIQFEFGDYNKGHFGILEKTIEELLYGNANDSNNRFKIEFTENSNIDSMNGEVEIKVKESKNYRFIDILKLGVQINLSIGIDYTLSNLVPNDPKSLHSIVSLEPSPYERAIRSCGSIVAYYDFDQLFPVFGFGGNIPEEKKTSHCFNVNFDKNNPEVKGIDGVIDAYKNSLNIVRFSGPTNFSPLIKYINNYMREKIQSNFTMDYMILMIITDGIITDLPSTKHEIVDSSKLPISIIIIGVGNADFSSMIELDGDDNPVTNYNGDEWERDIVQFVPFNKYEGNYDKLSEEVLAEIPKQIEEFYSKNEHYLKIQ